MNENQPNLVNENVLLEQGERNNKKIVAYASIGLGVLLLIFILFWSLKSLGNSDEQDNVEAEEQSINLSDSVKKNKDFTLSNDNSQNLLDLINNEKKEIDTTNTPQRLPNKQDVFMPQMSNTLNSDEFAKPRIIKGMGVAVVVNNKDIGSASIGGGRDLSLVAKPDTVLEFGQNGRLTLEEATAQARQIAGMTDGSASGSNSTGEIYQATVARFSNFNPSLLLPKGTYIGCALQTRLVSELKGGISCVVSSDVYSSNGHTLLIEKGSLMTGSYSSGELNDGSTRLFVIWQEIRTPNNVIIPVYSGATDTLGASGVEGYVNHHYMKRFGAAILLSVIDDSLAIIANELSRKGNNTNYYDFTENSRQQASEIANTALKEMIDIKPTLYKNQGDLVGVYVNKDIDFSKVYQLRRKQ